MRFVRPITVYTVFLTWLGKSDRSWLTAHQCIHEQAVAQRHRSAEKDQLVRLKVIILKTGEFNVILMTKKFNVMPERDSNE